LNRLIPTCFARACQKLAQFAGAILIIAISDWRLLFLLLPVCCAYSAIQRQYTIASGYVRKRGAVVKPIMMSHVAESAYAASAIRAFGVADFFSSRNAEDVDRTVRIRMAHCYSNRWLELRLEGLSHAVLAVAGFLGVIGGRSDSVVGLSLATVYALEVPNIVNELLRILTHVDIHLSRFRQASHFAQALPQEAAKPGAETADKITRGRIVFENFTAKYGNHLPPALDNVSFALNPGEKVGIVGRTGAGKSTLVGALFRLVEATSGRILVDGVPLENLGPRDWRGKLAIVPQDAGLFAGKLADNLDPSNKVSRGKLTAALVQSGLEASLRSSGADGDLLDYPISSGGMGLSAGQKQLVCLARAMLARPAVALVLDEATASADKETEMRMSQAVEEAFADTTTLIVAHRLSTVMSCDRLIVLEKGKVVEMGSPRELMNIPNGHFASFLT